MSVSTSLRTESSIAHEESKSLLTSKLLDNDLHPRKSLWKTPVLHRDVALPSPDFATHYESHRSETWYELFYDLVFVAAAIQIGHIVQYNISFEALFKSGLLFAVMRGTWDQLMFYQNRFDTKDLIHYVFYLLQAMCVFVMANHLTIDADNHHHWDRARNMKPFAIAAAVARFTHVIMYYQVTSITSKYRHHIFALSMSERLSGLIFLLSAVIPQQEEHYYIYWIVALLCERTLVHSYIFFFIHRSSSSEQFSLPWHTGHVYHREGTFILLILGEAIIQLVQYAGGISATEYVRGLLGFAVVFNVGDIYYQQQLLGKQVMRETHEKQVHYTWMSLHMFLSMSILFFAVGVKLVYQNEDHLGTDREEYLMCIFAAISLGIVYFLRMEHRGFYGSRFRYASYTFKFVVSGLCSVIPAVTHHPIETIAALFVMTSILVIQDVLVHHMVHRKASRKHGANYDSSSVPSDSDSGSDGDFSDSSDGRRRSSTSTDRIAKLLLWDRQAAAAAHSPSSTGNSCLLHTEYDDQRIADDSIYNVV